MAPTNLVIASAAYVVVAFSFGGAQAGLINNKDAALSLTSQHNSNTQVGWSSISSASSSAAHGTHRKTESLARGSMARNVAAAQYALAANRGFFSWWPSWGLRSFLGWWASWGQKKADDSAALLPAKPDAIVDTTQERKARKADSRDPTSRKFIEVNGTYSEEEVADATLDEAGYKSVSATRSEGAMISLMRRAAEKVGLKVVDDETLLDVVKFYDGECATQSFRNLVEELHRAEHPYLCHRAWTSNGKEAVTEDVQIAALAALGGKVVTSSGGSAVASVGIGSSAKLSERGYQSVAAARDTAEMMTFIERVLASVNLRVKDRSGLEHFAPYYSSECARQSYARLLKELRMAPTRPHSCGGGWVEML